MQWSLTLDTEVDVHFGVDDEAAEHVFGDVGVGELLQNSTSDHESSFSIIGDRIGIEARKARGIWKQKSLFTYDSNFSPSLARSQARSMDPTASEEPTEDKDCYEYNGPVYTFEECKRICFSNNFTLAVWTGAINQCVCC
eukprot:maker-scaffold52_size450388-snap-gene-2.14 protein:Tk02871 transcript:maker-scaffold52_size450388-snap-gene-2.14-mRNA-1 annotation:"selenoprotein o and cysteine-containing like protein"